MPKVKVNGLEIYYEEHGSGDEKLVFGHGAGSSGKNSWRTIWPLLPANYHCYALDFRGHGKLAEVTENFNSPQMADDVYQFSREMGLGKFIYVGGSMGGRVGIDLAIAHSEVLKGLVLVVPGPARPALQPADWLPATTYAELHKPEIIRASLESFAVRGPIPEELMQEAIEDVMLQKEETFLQGSDALRFSPDVESRLGEIKAPTLMLISGKDAIIPSDEQWRTVKQIPGAKAVFFEDEGHLIIWENPQRLVNEMIFFIDQLNK